MEATMITGIQLRAALGLLGWSVADLGKRTGLGSTVLNDMKRLNGVKPNAAFTTLERVRDAVVAGISEEREKIAEGSPQALRTFDEVASPIMRIATTDNGGIQPKGE